MLQPNLSPILAIPDLVDQMMSFITIQLISPNSTNQMIEGDLSLSDSNSDVAVIFVHGYGSHRRGDKSTHLRQICERQAISFASFDFRGHGKSSGSMRALTISGLVEDLETIHRGLLDHGIERTVLVGSSMGGLASGWFAAKFPEKILGLVLIAPAFKMLERRWSRLTEEERIHWQQTGTHRFEGPYNSVDHDFAFMAERSMFQINDLAPKVACPSLLFHGMKDDIVPCEDSLEFLQLSDNPNLELRLLKSGDHRLTDFKDEIAAEVCRFFNRVTKSN
jgi:uncharacterized protein